MKEHVQVGDSFEVLLVVEAPHSWGARDIADELRDDYKGFRSDLLDQGVTVNRRSPRPNSGDEQLDFPLRQFSQEGVPGWVHYTYWKVTRIEDWSPLLVDPAYSLASNAAPTAAAFLVPVLVVLGFLTLLGGVLVLLASEIRVLLRESGGALFGTAASIAAAALFVWLSIRGP